MKFLPIAIILILGCLGAPLCTHAALVKVESDFTRLHVGDVLTVFVTVDTQLQTLNAIEASIVYPSDLLEFISSDGGDSVVTVWLRNTKAVQDGIISFAGITPGGFVQEDASIIEVSFKVLGEGQGVIGTQDLELLLHDGLGTQATVVQQNLHIMISEGPSTILKKPYQDDELPEFFTPIVSYDADVFDGDAFLVFATVDKNSGLSHYEVKEGFFGRYVIAQSPHKIQNQKQDRKIFVKAVDVSGNERIAVVYPQHQSLLYKNIKTIGIIVVLCVLSFLGYVVYRVIGALYRR